MAEDFGKRCRRMIGHLEKLEASHQQVDEMMAIQVADGLGAQQYGQLGSNNVPDPTSRVAFKAKTGVDGREVIVWRDHRPEDDRKALNAHLKDAEYALEQADIIRQRYMSANNEIKLRLDPTDWCRIHFHLQHYEGHRRYRGDLCSLCYRYKEANGHEPTPTEVDYHHVHARWPHKLYDPKSRKVV
jgi:hypothetical protein